MNSKKTKILLFSLTVFLTAPLEAFALTFEDMVNRLLDIIGMIVPVLVALAVVGFFWGIVKYIFSAGKPDEKQEGAKFMLYGVIALFVMISVWGLVALLQNTIFGGSTTFINSIPQV